MEAIGYRVKVANIQELPVNLGKTIKIGAIEMALFHLANGEVRAVENRCPHRGGVLAEGMVSGEHVFCPMHDWKINVKDGKVQAPDTGCIKVYKTEIVNGDVIVIL